MTGGVVAGEEAAQSESAGFRCWQGSLLHHAGPSVAVWSL